LEPVFAKFDSVISGIDGCHGERTVGPYGSNRSPVDEYGCSRNSALNDQRRRNNHGLQIENHFGLLAFANADLLFWKILESALGHSYNVFLEFEVGDAQLATLGGLPLKFTVKKNPCLVLTSDD